MSSKSSNILANIIKGGLFILPIFSLFISSAMFFPFITGKNFFFRTVVEILFFLWIILMVFDVRFRLKKSPLFVSLAAVLIIMFLAAIFGENFSRSFWSNYERMEGVITHLHLFAYFLMLSSVFKKEKDFKLLFLSIITIGAVASAYAYLQFAGYAPVHQGGTKLDATFGNSTYLAIFIVFNLFLIGWMFLKNSNVWARSLLAFLFVFEFPIVYYTMTRGAILGFVGGLIIFAGLMAVFSKNKKIRLSFVALLVLLFATVGIFIGVRNTNFVKNRPTLNKIATISLKQGTVESRLTIWKMGYEGFKERPVLGWGPENFNLVFNKYYKPNMWKQEPWFDRAHNIVFDWLVTSGILGFSAYLSVFFAAIYMLWKKNKLKTEPALFTALFGAYSFHNLFVFDNLTSYYLFFTVLGYVHYNYTSNNNGHENKTDEYKHIKAKDVEISHYLIITASFVFIIFALYFVNLKPYLAARKIITALREASQSVNANNVLSEFDGVFSYRTFGTPEAREQLAGYASNIAESGQFKPDDKKQALEKAAEEMNKQIKDVPGDARYYLFLGNLYARLGRNDDALSAYNKARELSPKKQQIHFLLADIYLAKGDNAKALEILNMSYESDKTNTDAAKNLALVLILDGKEKEGEDLLQNSFGKKIIPDKMLVNAYAKIENYSKVKEIWLEIIKTEDIAQNHVSLAATYLKLDEKENAIKELEKAVEINPQFKQQADYFINEIKAGRNP